MVDEHEMEYFDYEQYHIEQHNLLNDYEEEEYQVHLLFEQCRNEKYEDDEIDKE
jgi:hypothetical protein